MLPSWSKIYPVFVQGCSDPDAVARIFRADPGETREYACMSPLQYISLHLNQTSLIPSCCRWRLPSTGDSSGPKLRDTLSLWLKNSGAIKPIKYEKARKPASQSPFWMISAGAAVMMDVQPNPPTCDGEFDCHVLQGSLHFIRARYKEKFLAG